jgi:hypothetical protein
LAKTAIAISRACSRTDLALKDFYDKLVTIRQELRNFVAQGLFGTQGEAFQFHSSAGAVPALLPHRAGSRKLSLGDDLAFDVEQPVRIIEAFIPHLWSGSRASAEIYMQHYLFWAATVTAR